MDVPPKLDDFSLVRGGPLFKAELRLRLVRPRRYGMFRVSFLLALLAWLPLVVFSLVRGGEVFRSLLGDIQIHVQFLVSLPVLIAAEPYIDGRITLATRQFLLANLIGVGHRSAFEKAALSAMRWRDSAIAEACLLVVAFALSFFSDLGARGAWSVTGTEGGPSLAGWWYLSVSSPLFRFMLLRWLWRATLWVVFLYRVSRLPLSLVPTHPDVMGGLGFLPVCQSSFAPVVFALSAVTSSYTWKVESPGLSSDPLAYLVPMAVFAALSVIAVFAPMGFFSFQLLRAKRVGDHAFSALASTHSRWFERRWFHGGVDKQVLGAPDFSSLADLGTAFTVMRRMRLFLWDQRALLGVAGAALAPLLVLLIMDRQFLKVVMELHEGLL